MKNHLRIFVVDKNTGKPRPHVPVGIKANVIVGEEKDATPITDTLALGMYQSDHAGYLSVDLQKLSPRPAVESIWVHPLAEEEAGVEVSRTLFESASAESMFIALKIPQWIPSAAPGQYPSIPDPDCVDWKVSPNSFGSKTIAIVGEDGCESLLPSDVAAQTFRFTQLIREIKSRPKDLAPVSHGDLADCELKRDDLTPTLCYRLGALLTYEMTWQSVGHGLGQVLYSLPLAPCESINLAIVDWARQEEISRIEDTKLSEGLIHNQRRHRTIEEIVRATLQEVQSGGSFLLGGAVAGMGQGYSGTGAFGLGASTTEGDRRVGAKMTQTLADGVEQVSNALRGLHSTVVVQASQAEQDVIQTRTVTNHNRCHAMTVLYYEVVRNYSVIIRLADVQDVILIQYQDQWINDFSVEYIIRHRLVLERVLLDERLRTCFDAVEKLYCAQLDFDPSLVRLQPDDYVIDPSEEASIGVRITTGDTGTREAVYFNLVLEDEQTTVSCISVDPPRSSDSAQLPSARQDPSGGLHYHFKPRQEDFFKLMPERPVRWGSIKQIEIEHGGDEWDLAHLQIVTTHGTELWVLIDDEIGRTVPDPEDGSALRLIVDPPGGPRTPEDTLTTEERCCVQQLRGHLNANLLHYNRAIWLLEDLDARALRFDQYKLELPNAEGETETARLIDFIENRPVGVSGDYVAFPLGRSDLFADGLSTENEPHYRCVSLPTPGAFAESKLSHCNACEKRDITRESPCHDRAPAITGISPGSRARDRDIQPTPLPESIINIQDLAEAPGPTGLAAVLELLGKSEIFRDMSASEEVADIMKKLIEGAVELEKAKMMGATRRDAGDNTGETGMNDQDLRNATTEQPGAASPRELSEAERALERQNVIDRERPVVGDDEHKRRTQENLDRMNRTESSPSDGDPVPHNRYSMFDIMITSISAPGGVGDDEVDVMVTGRIRGVKGIRADDSEMTSPWYAFRYEGRGRVIGVEVDTSVIEPQRFSTSAWLQLPDAFENVDCEVKSAGIGLGLGLAAVYIEISEYNASVWIPITAVTGAFGVDSTGQITELQLLE